MDDSNESSNKENLIPPNNSIMTSSQKKFKCDKSEDEMKNNESSPPDI